MKKLDEAQRRKLILEGNIGVILMVLAAPTLMMSVVQSLIPLIDGLFINNISGTLVASAVTFSNPFISILVAIAQGLSAAAMAVTGQVFGAGDFPEVKRISNQITIFGFALGIAAMPVMVLLALMTGFYVNPEIADNVRLYLMLYALVLPFTYMESIYNALMNASGRPEKPFIRMVIMLVLKCIFNVIFIYWLRLDIVGCALASLGANMFVFFWMMWELYIQPSSMQLSMSGYRPDWPFLRKLMKIGIPSMLTQMMLGIGFVLINNEIQKYGAVVLNGQGIAGNITGVCFNLPASFGAAVTTVVSMNIGSGQPKRARGGAWKGCLFSALTAALIISLIVPLSGWLTVLFTREQEVLEIADKSLHIYTYSVIGFGVCSVVQGAMIGLGRTRVPLALGVLRIWLLRYLFILATERFLSFYSVFWGNLFSNYMAALISLVILALVPWRSVIDKN